MKEFAGIVLIVGYHFQIVVRSLIERFPAILPIKQSNLSRQALTFFVVWVEAGGRACLTVYMESGLAPDLRIASPETGRHTEPPRTPLARQGKASIQTGSTRKGVLALGSLSTLGFARQASPVVPFLLRGLLLMPIQNAFSFKYEISLLCPFTETSTRQCLEIRSCLLSLGFPRWCGWGVETSMPGRSKVTCYCCCSASCSSSRNFFRIFAFLTRNWIRTKYKILKMSENTR
ncbi:hypothetical protein L195_g044561, partial [Trifolium pratense]